MSVATAGAKNAVLDELEEEIKISVDTRTALEKLNIRELLFLIKDLRRARPGE